MNDRFQDLQSPSAESKMPSHVAHDLLNAGLSAGSDALVLAKRNKYICAPVQYVIEYPVQSAMKTKLGKITLNAGDRVVSAADGVIDRAMNTAVYKTTSNLVKKTYTSKVKAIGNLKKNVVNKYHKVLVNADALVDKYLPGTTGKDNIKQPSLLVKKNGVKGDCCKKELPEGFVYLQGSN